MSCPRSLEAEEEEVDVHVADLFADPPSADGAVVFEKSGDTPMSQWSSLLMEIPEENVKRLLAEQGLYAMPSDALCAAYIAMSDSAVLRHPYYNYPAVTDPGIRQALLEPDPAQVYPDDGQDVYLKVCAEMGECPVRLFYRGLLGYHIDLSYYGIAPSAVRAMCMALARNKTVVGLNLTDNWLSDDSCYHLGRLLLENSTLTDLNLYGCRIGPVGMRRLCDTLVFNRTLRGLGLARNQLGDEGLAILAQALTESATVVRLNLSHNELTDKSAMALVDALENTNKLTHLDLSWNLITLPQAVAGLLWRLSQSKSLVELNLAWNALAGARIGTGIRNLMTIPTLQSLDLSNNKFADEAIDPIAAWLFKAKRLHTLNMSNNPMTPGGAVKLLSKLKLSRVKLQNLRLDNVCVDTMFIELLASVREMKNRVHTTVTHGFVLGNYAVAGPDARELLLRRAAFLASKPKRRPVDIAVLFVTLHKEHPAPMETKDLMTILEEGGVDFDDDLVEEFATLFPGPKTSKGPRTIDLGEYVRRLWPNARPPPTPPPTPPPPPSPPPNPTQAKKGKGKKK